MTSDKLPADTTTSGSDAVAENGESKVLKFDESNLASPAKDINTKITALDTDLAHLRAELSAINGSVEEGLDRLGDTDTDLTAKVSETNAAYLRGFCYSCGIVGLRFANPTYENLLSDCIWLLQALSCRSG